MIGSTAGSPYDLKHNVSLEIGETLQQWANVLLTFIESGEEGEHWLLTASGYAENTGMQWKNSEKTSVGRNWGSGPPLVEAIPLRLQFSERTALPQLFRWMNVDSVRIIYRSDKPEK